jgi:hypothetical protein
MWVEKNQNLTRYNPRYSVGTKVKVSLESDSRAKGLTGIVEKEPKYESDTYKIKIESKSLTLFYILFEQDLEEFESDAVENASMEAIID